MHLYLRTLSFHVAALWAAPTVDFFLPRTMPGNSNEPVRRRRLERLSSSASGNLDASVTSWPESVGHVIGQSFPWTIELTAST